MINGWKDLEEIMRKSGVTVDTLVSGTTLESKEIDRAVDNLLGMGNIFLRRAAEFQHMLSLAQPLKDISAILLKKIEAVMRVAHRVQSLTPGSFGNFLMQTFGDSRAE